MKKTPIRRGDIFWVNFDPALGTETQKVRPALICSHDILNEVTERVIVAPITSNVKRIYHFEYKLLPQHDLMGKIMLDQLRSIDKSRLGKPISRLYLKEMNEIDAILKFLLGLG